MAAAGGAGGAPYLIIKTRERTQPRGSEPILFKRVTAGKEFSAASLFASRFIYFNGAEESGFAPDFISSALPGTLYTWIIKETVEGYVLVAARTRGAQELGTLHVNLDALSAVYGIVISAGELKRTPTGVEYNLLSGSFMEPIFKPTARGANIAERRRKAVSVAADLFNRLFPDNAVNVDKQLIIPASILTEAENMAIYSDILNTNAAKTGSRTEGVNMSGVATKLFGGARRTVGRTRRATRKHKHKRRTLRRGQ